MPEKGKFFLQNFAVESISTLLMMLQLKLLLHFLSLVSSTISFRSAHGGPPTTLNKTDAALTHTVLEKSRMIMFEQASGRIEVQ